MSEWWREGKGGEGEMEEIRKRGTSPNAIVVEKYNVACVKR